MKTLALMLATLFVQPFFAQEANTSTITVVIEKLTTDEGEVFGSLYSEKTFLISNPELTAKAEIKNGTAVLIFENVPRGVYGVTAFHDENGNEKMDFEATGMPKENYGSSNNKFNPYGPPTWSDARFEVTGEAVNLNIHLTR